MQPVKRKSIDVGRDYSDVPAGRYPADGEFNGQRFREEILVPALESNDRVEVIIDNTEGFGSSFLEEAFGGLIRKNAFTKEQLLSTLIIIADTRRAERYKRKIWHYIDVACPEERG